MGFAKSYPLTQNGCTDPQVTSHQCLYPSAEVIREFRGVAERGFNRDGLPDVAYTVNLYAPNSILSNAAGR